MTPIFTAAALLYGDYPELAVRCLAPLREAAALGLVELRVGANAVSPRVLATISDLSPVVSPYNIGKYPMMRWLLDRATSDFVTWFDDDSYITTSPDAFFADLAGVMADTDLAGSVYTIALRPGQREWIAQQPWYKANPKIHSDEFRRVQFCTGGWWCARVSKLREIGYPWSSLFHNGGDVMLGVAAAQQGWRVTSYNKGVAINADASGKESAAPRRGLDTLPIGAKR